MPAILGFVAIVVKFGAWASPVAFLVVKMVAVLRCMLIRWTGLSCLVMCGLLVVLIVLPLLIVVLNSGKTRVFERANRALMLHVPVVVTVR